LRVADPGDNADIRAIMRTAVETPGPAYFRVTRLTVPDLFGADHAFDEHVQRFLAAVRERDSTGRRVALALRPDEVLVIDGDHHRVEAPSDRPA
jgi:hypothetical protein